VQRQILLCTLIALATGVRPLRASIDYSSVGGVYTQNFNSLAASGTEQDWSNDSTIVGWHLFRVTAGNNPSPFPMTLYDTSDGSAENSRFYSFGTTTDRALGGIGGGTFGHPNAGDRATGISVNQPAGWIAANFVNSTGSQLTRFTLNYDGEQWRDAGDNEPPYAQTMEFQYGFGADFATVSSWITPGGSFSFTSPVFTTTDGPVNGNGAGRIASLGGSITNLDWQSGATLWLRWVERNDLVFDHGLAIDNVSFSASGTITAVPEAGPLAIGAIVCCLCVIAVGGRATTRWLFPPISQTSADLNQ